MSDIQSFYTQQTKVTGATAQTNTALKGSGLFSLNGGMAFWDMITSQLGKEQQNAAQLETAKVIKAETQSSLSQDDMELAAAIDESLLELLGEQSDSDDGKLKPLSLLDIMQVVNGSAETIEGEVSLFQKLVDRLAAGLPLESRGEQEVDALIARLKKQAEFLKTGKINDQEVPIPLLIALGVSPAQLTQISDKIARLEEKLGREITVEDIIAGIGGIIDAQKDKNNNGDIAFAIGGVPASVAKIASGNGDGENSARMTPVSGNVNTTNGERRDGYVSNSEAAQGYKGTQIAGAAQSNGVGAPASKGGNAATQTGGFLLASTGAQGDIATAQAWHTLFGAYGTIEGGEIQTGIPLTQATQAAHAATAIAQAGQAHPATHMLATTLNKMARNGGPAEMTIHMDPPELGRVVAKMQFGQDKTVKTILLVEKPETYHMLIRDAASLERALQDAGLTTDSASLSFELAQDGSAFNSDNNGEGGGEPNGKTGTDLASEDSDGQSRIETTMTWQVDPQTGYIRYDLLA